jgi:hypothetical protein
MGDKALEILSFLGQKGPQQLNLYEHEIINKLCQRGLITLINHLPDIFKITSYGSGVLQEIERIGKEAKIKYMESYLS